MKGIDDNKNKLFNINNKIREKIDNINGIAALIVYDGIISDLEFQFLNEWLLANDEYLIQDPLDKLKELFQSITADGQVSKEERNQLLELLISIADEPQGDVVRSDIFTLSPLIEFPMKRFVITGQFIDQRRDLAVNKIYQYGGYYQEKVTNETDYIIVGALGSEAWRHGKYGTKICKGVELQRKDIPVQIITEKDFKKAIISIEEK